MIKRKIDFSKKTLTALELNAINRLNVNGKRFIDYESSIDGVLLNWAGNFLGGVGIGAMRVASNGAIGINTDNPLRAFHVVSSSTQIMLESTNNHKVGFWSDGNAQAFKLVTWSNTEIGFGSALSVFQNTRNVAIGTDIDPLVKFHVLGSSRFTGQVELAPSGSGDVFLGSYSKFFANTGNLSIGSTTDNGYKLNVVGNTRLTGQLTLLGNMGVKSMALDVQFSQYIKMGGNDSTPLFRVFRSDGTMESQIRTNGWGDFEVSKGLAVGIATTLGFTGLLVNGKISCNTLDPKSNLHIVGLPTFNSNADSITGGLTAGAFYRNATGQVFVTY